MSSHTDKSFDVIIVGGGTAGLVLAHRLSEDAELQVLVLEAGENRNGDSIIEIPGLMSQTWDNPKYDWSYETVPQKHLKNRVIKHPGGKVLGGTSCINVMSVNYPVRNDLDFWAELGNEGWNWETMSQYYKKYQTLHQPDPELLKVLDISDYADFDLYGTNGPVSTSFSSYRAPMHGIWQSTLQALDYKTKADPLSGRCWGAYVNTTFMGPDAVRSHAGLAYWQPIASRSNVHLIAGAHVEGLVLEKKGGMVTATGVQYVKDGEQYVVNAAKEVILSAGTFASPALLELSGIGDARRLDRLDIETLVDNSNVGENLQDHPMASIVLEVKEPIHSSDSQLRDPEVMKNQMAEYQTNRTGLLAQGFNSLAYLPVFDFVQAGPGQTTLETLLAMNLDKEHMTCLSPGQRAQIEYLESVNRDPESSTGLASGIAFDMSRQLSAKGHDCISLSTALVHPFSRGRCHITSVDPAVHPKIDPNYFSNPLDLEVMARHLVQFTQFTQTSPMKEALKHGGATHPSTAPFTSIEDAKNHVLQEARSQYHPCGTCAMMSRELGGVVDDRLKVYGTSNLRVVDASVFPLVPQGPITSTVYAVAERAADLIKEDLAKT